MARYKSKAFGEADPHEPVIIVCTCKSDPSQCPRHPPAATPEQLAAKCAHPDLADRAHQLAARIRELEARGIKGPRLYRELHGADFFQGPKVHLWTDFSNAPHSVGKVPRGED